MKKELTYTSTLLTSFPFVVGNGESGRFHNKEKYPLLTRLAYCQCFMREVFLSVLNYFRWTDISLIIDRSELDARGLGESLDEGFLASGIYPNLVSYYSQEDFDYADLLKQASLKSRGEYDLKNV